MANIFDYMLWRDIPLSKTEFNEIDNLILARFSYFPLDEKIIDAKKAEVKALAEKKWNYIKNFTKRRCRFISNFSK